MNTNITTVIRRISTPLLLLILVIQLFSVILMELDLEFFEVEELHEICGFAFFGLAFVHLILFRKLLLKMFASKK